MTSAAQAKQMPFAPESFDLVMSIGVCTTCPIQGAVASTYHSSRRRKTSRVSSIHSAWP